MKTYSVVFKGWRSSQVIEARDWEVRDGRYWFATGSTGHVLSLAVQQVACVVEKRKSPKLNAGRPEAAHASV